jgi:hypothetical protein
MAAFIPGASPPEVRTPILFTIKESSCCPRLSYHFQEDFSVIIVPSDGFYRLQISYEGQLYWVGAWNIRVTNGSVQRVLDTAYLFAYGRLGSRLSADISRTTNTLYNIESIWLSLQAGETVYCTNIPPYASRKASDTDVSQEPVFAPLIAALDNGINSTNAAISRFSDACSRTDVFLTDQDVIAALTEIELARQNLNVASSLLVSLKVRDPLVGR